MVLIASRALRYLCKQRLRVQQQRAHQGSLIPDVALEVDCSHEHAMSGNLNEDLASGAFSSQQEGQADHSLAPDVRDFDRAAGSLG
jgi:hypothetical protein